MQRRSFLQRTAAALPVSTGLFGSAAWAQSFPARPLELIVPFGAGGGTDAVARAYADTVRKYLGQTVTVVNKPGASAAIGLGDVANAPPDGYKLAMITVELVTLPHLGMVKFTYEDFTPIVRLNADPSAITVRADSPWQTIEEFLDAARKRKGELQMGNAGIGSIWHLAAAALEEKTGVQFNHIPFQGGGPAVLALAGGHVDAVAVSPAEVVAQVNAGKLRTLAVMADARVKGFEKVPTLKERKIDLSIGTWRGIAAPKNTPAPVVAALVAASTKAAHEQAMLDTLDRLNLGISIADAATFRADMARDNAAFKALIVKLGLKN